MNYRTTALLAFLPLLAIAEQNSYVSFANKITLQQDSTVAISILPNEEDSEIACGSEDYDFSFAMDSIIKEKWYDTLVLSRNSNQLIEFHYDQQSCLLSGLTLPEIYDADSNVGNETGVDTLEETGTYDNVALINTNGLQKENYTASSYYSRDEPAAAFDGYVYDQKDNPDSEFRLARGIWLAKRTNSSGTPIEPWIQVNFNKTVKLSGMRLAINEKSLQLGRSPRNIKIQYSDDGEEFIDHSSHRLALQESYEIQFSNLIEAQYVRLVVESNFGDKLYVEIDEWELFQP